jgi:hypothetical protein
MTSLSDPYNVGDYLISVLDFPGGASSFSCEASELGVRVTAVDPVYAMSTSALQNGHGPTGPRKCAHGCWP